MSTSLTQWKSLKLGCPICLSTVSFWGHILNDWATPRLVFFWGVILYFPRSIPVKFTWELPSLWEFPHLCGQVFLMPRACSFDCDHLTITLCLFKRCVCLWQQHLGDSLVKETLSSLNFTPVTKHGDGMKQDLCLNWYQPLHYPPSKWKVVQHHRGPHPLFSTNSSVGSFTSHKNQNSARAVRWGLRFFVLIQED